jgi:large subunit ribosomal protein L6
MPVPITKGVTITQGADREVKVKGPKGELSLRLRPEIDLKVEADQAVVSPNGSGPPKEAGAYYGMTRALINNMVTGVTQGFEKTLEIVGVGWNAQSQGKKIVLNIGFCHPVEIDMPEGVTCESPKPTTIVIKGADKQAVGQIAAVIRKVRPPEPYKGKGIRYQDEFVRRKAGKSFGS